MLLASQSKLQMEGHANALRRMANKEHNDIKDNVNDLKTFFIGWHENPDIIADLKMFSRRSSSDTMDPASAIDGTFNVVKTSHHQESRACSQLWLIELTIQLCKGMERTQMRPRKLSSTDRKIGDDNENPKVPAIRTNNLEDDVLEMVAMEMPNDMLQVPKSPVLT